MHTPSVTGILVFCFSVGVGKRSSGTLPPVGGAQQSQVAVGGTWSAAEQEEEEEATGQQPASVCPKTGWKTQGSGQVEVFSTVPVATEAFSRQGHQGKFFFVFLFFFQGRERRVSRIHIGSHFSSCLKILFKCLYVHEMHQLYKSLLLLSKQAVMKSPYVVPVWYVWEDSRFSFVPKYIVQFCQSWYETSAVSVRQFVLLVVKKNVHWGDKYIRSLWSIFLKLIHEPYRRILFQSRFSHLKVQGLSALLKSELHHTVADSSTMI